jgi:small conductance mechanosensitive channel
VNILFSFQAAWEKLLTKVAGWLDQLVLLLPNLLLGILVMVTFVVIARSLKKGFIKVMDQISDQSNINRLLGTLGAGAIILLGFFLMLSVLNLNKAVTSLLAGAGILGLALGFAFQDLITNLISGIMIAIRKPFVPGDLIETNNIMGNVQRINLRNTIIRSFQGQNIIIPNKEVFQKTLKNYSTGYRRIDLDVGVSYGEDLEKVEEVTLDAINAIPYLSNEHQTQLYFLEFGDSSINFRIVYWIPLFRQPDYFRATSDGVKAIHKAFNQNDIVIPFPIRTLDFGIKGGEKLNQMLPMGSQWSEN